MIWWDWTGSKRLALTAAMLAVAAFPGVVLGWLPDEWRAFVGGTAFLMLPLVFGWFLFVGLSTGRIPARGGSETRSVTPVWFWGVAATYAVFLVFFVCVIVFVAAD
jgi:hypothetical protein